MSVELPSAVQALIRFIKLQCGIDLQLSTMQPLQVIETRMQAQGCATHDDYLFYVQSHDEELQALVEDVVVPETWFFRYPESFEFLVEHIATKRGEVLDVLSIPCSTGEEPYSIAMSLLMHGIPHQKFQVDAADISEVALSRAKAAVYYEHSFRHHELSFRDQYFDALFDRDIQRPYWKLHPHVCQCVNFSMVNILQSNVQLKSAYDVIFCRNLLIYFDKEAQAKVLERLYSMLKPDGLLFLGHAGSGHDYLLKHMTLLNHRAFVWQKGVQQKANILSPLMRPKYVAHKEREPEKTRQILKPVPNVKPAKLSLETIESLANQGKLKEAKKSCEHYTLQYPNQAEGWYLFGVIMQAENRLEKAKQHFQKTLYLEPNHENSLLQLAGIAEHEGHRDKAQRFRQRWQQRQT